MTVEPVAEPFTANRISEYFLADADGRAIQLPGRPYMALRITRVTDDQIKEQPQRGGGR
jgi:hypothetical protein